MSIYSVVKVIMAIVGDFYFLTKSGTPLPEPNVISSSTVSCFRKIAFFENKCRVC